MSADVKVQRVEIINPTMWFLNNFLSRGQARVITKNCTGEEGGHFLELVARWAKIAHDMPVVYETDGMGDDALVQLHYFRGNWDWWIIERDVNEQDQAFGLVKGCDVELGYIHLPEVLGVGAELDLYWEPKRLGDVRAAAEFNIDLD